MLDKDFILKIKLLLKKNLVEVIHVSSYIATIINAHLENEFYMKSVVSIRKTRETYFEKIVLDAQKYWEFIF